jgi:hypothetical protein
VVFSKIVLLIFHRKTPGKLHDVRNFNTLSAGIVYVAKCWSRNEGLWFDCRQVLILYFPITPTTTVGLTHLLNKYVLGPFVERERLQLCISNILYHAAVKICLHLHVL